MLVSSFLLFAVYCSTQAQSSEEELIKGKEILTDDAPWVVSIAGVLSGVILHARWVLTSNFNGDYKFIKIKGATLDFGDGEIILVDKHFPHPSHYRNSTVILYSFRLLKLQKEIEFDKYAQPIEIGDESLIKPGKNVTVVGWGVRSHSLKSFVLTITDCGTSFPDGMFCAVTQKNGEGPCTGVGPATIDKKLVGVYSMRVGDCDKFKTQYYFGNVPALKDWIYETMKNNSDSTKTESNSTVKQCSCEKTSNENQHEENKKILHLKLNTIDQKPHKDNEEDQRENNISENESINYKVQQPEKDYEDQDGDKKELDDYSTEYKPNNNNKLHQSEEDYEIQKLKENEEKDHTKSEFKKEKETNAASSSQDTVNIRLSLKVHHDITNYYFFNVFR